MNQSKFSLADVFTLIGALLFSLIFFLSVNLLTFGNLTQSIVYGVISFLVLGGLAFWIKTIKKTNYPSKSKRITELVMLFIFILLYVASFFFFSHYLELFNKENEVREEVIDNIEQFNNLYDTYDDYVDGRIQLYENSLISVAKAKDVNPTQFKDSCRFNKELDIKAQIKNKKNILINQLKQSNYNELREESTNWLANSKDKVEKWMAIGIVDIVKKLETNTTTWKNNLIELSKFRAQCESADINDFEFQASYKDITQKMITRKTPSSLLSYSCGVLLFFLMLFSYFITKRSTKDPGWKALFGNRKSDKTL